MGILGGLLKEILSPVTDIVGKAVVDKDKKRELDFKVQELIDKADQRFHDQLMGQIEVNKEEAKHPSIFVAGWRPAIGWVGATGLAYTFIVAPIFEFIGKATGLYEQPMPVLQTEYLMTLVTSMLGIAAMRSFDKYKGTDYKAVGRQREE